MSTEEREFYCGNCGLQLEETTRKCPRCGAPLASTLVTVHKREREWRNPDDYLIGRTGWIQTQFLKRWLPRYEDWLSTTTYKRRTELSIEELRTTRKEYNRFIAERKQLRARWTVPNEEGNKPQKAEKIFNDEFKRVVLDKLEKITKELKRLAESLEKNRY